MIILYHPTLTEYMLSQLGTLHGNGEVASAAVFFSVGGCVLDHCLPHWEVSAWLMATGYCEETTWETPMYEKKKFYYYNKNEWI